MRMPMLFVSHGSPMTAITQDDYTVALWDFAATLPSPRAIVCVSAHWESGPPIRVTSAARPSLIHDFGGFPDAMYALTYPCAGAPALAKDIVARLESVGQHAVLDASRGLDHGAWVPLRIMFPRAHVPVVQVSLPVARTPGDVLAMGRALAALRDEHVFLVGSGGIVHNMRRLVEEERAPDVGWAAEFDAWARDHIERGDIDALLAYAQLAPDAHLAVPTSEHWDPLYAVLGAIGAQDRLRIIYEGFRYGTLSMRTFAYGAE